jgi:hypothetical protein
MQADGDRGEAHVVEVEFNQQQDVILKRLRESGQFGTDDAEIIRNVFREFLRQTRL